MRKDHSDEILSYLAGEMTKEEVRSFEERLNSDETLREDTVLYRQLQDEIKALPILGGEESMEEEFVRWLEGQSNHTHLRDLGSNRRLYTLLVAASLGLLIGLFFLGRWSVKSPYILSISVEEDPFTLVKAASTSSRIKGINALERIENPDPEFVEALLRLVRYDESPNVRLRAVEALQTFSSIERVRHELIDLLDIEKQPIVQIAIINTLVQVQEGDAKIPLEKLISSKEIMPFVKDEARLGLTRL